MTYDEFKTQLPALLQDYQPSADALAKISHVSLLMIIGPSGAGKSTVISNLDIPYVPSDTTRPPRQDEVDGVDMNFLADYQQTVQDIKQGAFLQVVKGVSGDLYATRVSSYPDSGWATMPVLADVVPFFRQLGFKETLSVFITPPGYDEWMHRMNVHNLTQEQIQARLAEARRSFNFALQDNQMHFILNDNLDSAVIQTKDLLNGKVDAQREAVARPVIEALLQKI